MNTNAVNLADPVYIALVQVCVRVCALAAPHVCQHSGAAAALYLLLCQRSRRSSGSNANANHTPRCVGGHFEPRASRARAAAEKMSPLPSVLTPGDPRLALVA